jgi:hypothetical protein
MAGAREKILKAETIEEAQRLLGVVESQDPTEWTLRRCRLAYERRLKGPWVPPAKPAKPKVAVK